MTYEQVVVAKWRLKVEKLYEWGNINYPTYLQCVAILTNLNFNKLSLKQLKEYLDTNITAGT